MYSYFKYFKGLQCNIPCLAHPLPAAQQWRRPRSKGGRPRSGTACHNLQHAAAAAPVCSPVNLKQIAKAGLLAVEGGQQAWAGWGGGPRA